MQFTTLLNNLYGNTGLWIGLCVLSLAEVLLAFLQLWTCLCRTRREVPEVPSCRRRNFPEDEEGEGEGADGPEGPDANGRALPNQLNDFVPFGTAMKNAAITGE